MLNIKVKPLNEDPNKVLELLNKNKHNLLALTKQYDNIIDLYVQLLGGKHWGIPNANEVILPEIMKLLENSNYACEFTESGMYLKDKPVFTLSKDAEYGELYQTILIKNGKNECELSKGLINGQRGISLRRTVFDFSEIDESDYSCLSDAAKKQIETSLTRNHYLRKINIYASIAEGIELSKKIVEIYTSKKNDDVTATIDSSFSYHVNEPTISVNTYIDNSEPNYSLILYGADPGETVFNTRNYYGYGDSKISLEGKETCYSNYDYEKILKNIKSYQRKYCQDLHPLLQDKEMKKILQTRK